ncbi:MAG: GNAT family N-acetyltransferase [Nitrospirales bacterium]|nr:GNAT family N-acetyltransferase [Nitrospirales bacterium]
MTRRFVLRDLCEEDASAFEAYHADPRSLEFYGPDEIMSGHAQGLLETFAQWAKERPRRNYQLAIIQRRPPQQLIGCCGLRTAGSEGGRAELGIELAPEFWGRYGYAIEVMEALVEFGFRTLQSREIYGDSVSVNHRIASLADSFGAVAVTRPAPAWMTARGWKPIEWHVTRLQWEGGRLTLNPRFQQKGHEKA